LFLGTRLPYLGYDISNSDALRWHRRSERFLEAVKHLNFADTYQHYQPGVTLMWLGAGIKQITHSYQLTQNADFYPKIDGLIRSFLVISLGILLVFQGWMLNKLFSRQTSLFYMTLVALEPYLIGIDRWMHLTSLETYFAFTAFLALLVWRKFGRLTFLLFSSGCFALAVLSKVSALVVGVVLLAIIVETIFSKFSKQNTLKQGVVGTVRYCLVFGLAFCFAFFVSFPAMWVSPITVIQNLFGAVTNAVSGDVSGTYQTAGYSYLYYIYILCFKLSAITLFILTIALVRFKKLLLNFEIRFVFLYLLVVFVSLTLADKKIDRYVVSMIPPILLLGAYALTTLSKKIQLVFLPSSVIYLALVSFTVFPVFSAYYSPIFGGTKRAVETGLYDNSGEYLAQAAMYLNTKGRDKNVVIPYNIESFSPYYKGRVSMDDTGDFANPDYIVASLDSTRKSLELPCTTVDKTFGPRDFPVVYVFSCFPQQP